MSPSSQKHNRWLTWQAALVAFVIIGGGLAYAGFVLADTDSSPAIGDDEQLIPAQIGDLISLVATDGSLSYPNVEEVSFDITGKVGEILVSEGDAVSTGQPLATVDDVSVVGLAVAVAQARLAVRDAATSLAAAQAPTDALSIAAAQTAIAAAQQAVGIATSDLGELTDATQAQADVTALQQARANTSAQLGLVTAAQKILVDTARLAAATMAIDYVDEFVNWLNVPPEIVDPTLAPSDVLASMGADLSVIFPTTQQEINLALLDGTPTDNPATAWNEATIYLYVSFFPGAVIGDCAGTPPLQGICVSYELDTKWATLESLRTTATTAELASTTAIAAATTPVVEATASLEAAEAALANLIAGVDTAEVNLARATVASALATEEAAVAALADLRVTTDPREISLLQTLITAAELDLTVALERQRSASLVSPIDGVVTEVDMETGDSVGGTITIVDRSVIEIAGTVDEIDVLLLSEGAKAAIALTALPDQTLFGEITNIGTPENNQGVVTFPISIAVTVKEGLFLREGLTATASILIGQELNVLRVPTSAINGSFDAPYVRVSEGESVIERPVTLGSSDDFWVVIASGLVEGEQVVMPAPSGSSLDKIDFGGANAGEILLKLQAASGDKAAATKKPSEPVGGK
jgi:multidrug efflux pump subunit AcrA (membrane-fusion protein)